MTAALRYQTFWPRFFAGIVDALLVIPLIYAVDPWVWRNVSSSFLLVPWFVFNSIASVAYSVICHGLWGQTLGKRLLRVKVVDLSGAKLSMSQAAMRDAIYLGLAAVSLAVDLPVVATGQNPYSPERVAANGMPLLSMVSGYIVLGWTLAEFVTMLLNAKRRAVHDYMAHCVVVRTDGQSA